MFRMTSYLAAPAAVFLMGSTAAFALTADEVWQSWKDAGGMIGLEVTAATENKDGGTLTLNGISIAPAGIPGITISDMVLTEQSDGSVTIAPGADINLTLSGGTTGTSRIVHEGLTLTARDADGALTYDFAADKMDVVYDTETEGFSFDGSAPPVVKSSGTVGFSGLTGSYSDTPGANRAFGFDIKADTLAYNTSMDDPGMELKQSTTSSTAGVELSLDVVLPTSISSGGMTAAPADLSVALQEGLSISFATKQGDSTGSMTQESPFMPMSMTIMAGGGEASGMFNKDTVTLSSTGSGLDIETSSAMLPVPVKVTSGPLEIGFTSPVIATETAGDYGLVLKLSQFTINEEAWGLFDPAAALKRDPLDLAIDISGKTKMDLGAMIAASDMGMEPPVPAIESLDITELGLKVAGAALAATGAFTFDNSMGIPMPLGEANVSVTGANALIDGLISIGVIGEEEAMGARMMMGMFMAPGAGPDELTSKIEAREGFAIFVNGQQIQ